VEREPATQKNRRKRTRRRDASQAELDKILDALELEGLITRTLLKGRHVWQAKAIDYAEERLTLRIIHKNHYRLRPCKMV